MKQIKKLLAVLLALAIMAPIGTLTAYADSGTFKSGIYTVSMSLNATKFAGSASTTSNKKAEHLTVTVMGRRVDSSGDLVRLDMDDSYKYNTTSSGTAYISHSQSKQRYENVKSVHSAKFNLFKEATGNLSKYF